VSSDFSCRTFAFAVIVHETDLSFPRLGRIHADALRRKGTPVGSPARAPSFPVNPWENPVGRRSTGYTYFFPLDDSMVGEDLEVVLLGMKGGGQKLQPSVWITVRDLPIAARRVTR
jgi:hypothetical protein